MQKPQLVAVDTNVLMRLADGHEATIDAWQMLKLAEAAVLSCVLRVSRGSPLTGIDHDQLAFLFRQLDLAAPIISTPENLLKKLYPQ